jgi:two-component system phosphate regulon response regulator PhoB
MPAAPVRTQTVLVVEDDTAMRAVYRAVLKQAGYRVVAVSDGLTALQQLDSDALPDAVVLDLALPRLSGADFGRELQGRPDSRHIPIVIVTGTDGSGIEGLDVECVLQKPFLPERLLEAVDVCMRKG